MGSFKDTKDRDWTITLTVDNVDQVLASELNLDLYDLVDPEKSAECWRRLSHRKTLCVVVWILVKETAPAGFEPSEFGKAMAGPQLDAAAEAFEKALCVFFQNRDRQLLEMALAKHREVEGKSIERAQKVLSNPRTEAAIEGALNRAEDAALQEIESRLTPTTSAP